MIVFYLCTSFSGDWNLVNWNWLKRIKKVQKGYFWPFLDFLTSCFFSKIFFYEDLLSFF